MRRQTKIRRNDANVDGDMEKDMKQTTANWHSARNINAYRHYL